MCKGHVQGKRHACMQSSDNNIRWQMRQIVNGFTQGTQFKVPPSVRES